MPEATVKFIAKLAGVAPVTVSRVLNGAVNVAPPTREKILAIIRDLNYAPNIHAANLRRKKLSDESTSGSEDRLAGAVERVRSGGNFNAYGPSLRKEAFILSSEGGDAFARQLVQLCRDLDRLRNHTERIQTCVETMQETYSRRFSSSAGH